MVDKGNEKQTCDIATPSTLGRRIETGRGRPTPEQRGSQKCSRGGPNRFGPPPKLETDLAGHLDPASVIGNAVVNPAEDRRVNNRCRIIKRRVIRKVSEVESQVEGNPFGDMEFL